MKRSYRTIKMISDAINYDQEENTTSTTKDINHRLVSAMINNHEQIKQIGDNSKEPNLEQPNPSICDYLTEKQKLASYPRSISPPPYSPLTPLILRSNDIQEGTPQLSPLPVMSPETQMLYDTLCKSPGCFSDDQSSSQIGDSDDSVRDPDYLDNHSEVEDDESETKDEERDDGEENKLAVCERNNTTVVDEAEGILSTLGQKQDKEPTSILSEKQDRDIIVKQLDNDIMSTIDRCSPSIMDMDIIATMNNQQATDTISTTDEKHNKNGIFIINEGQTSDTTSTKEKQDKGINVGQKINNSSAGGSQITVASLTISERQNTEIISSISEEQHMETITIDKGQDMETISRIGEGHNMKTSTIHERQDTETTSKRGEKLDMETSSTIGEGQDTDTTSAIGNRQNQETSTGRSKLGRKRKYDEYTLAERKKRKYNNLPYQGKSKLVPSKVFEDYTCNCKNQCFLKVSKEIRKKEFETFVSLGSYEAQLLYIVCSVKENKKKRTYCCKNTKTGKKKPREYSRTYTIANTQVCRDMFIKTFQITPQKVTISLKKHRNAYNNNILKDRRGKASGGWNKTPQEDIDFVCKVIDSLPKYESHYRRTQIGEALYLSPGMTLQKVYKLYQVEHKVKYGGAKTCLSIDVVKRIFFSKFNLKFKSLKKDTCNKCDTIAAKLKSHNLTKDAKESLLVEKDKHLKAAESLREQMNVDIQQAKIDDAFECVTFDMEKTLPLPRMPTNIIFYKRQLWFYNCGIHVGSNNKGYCYVWLEGEAGRGAQEVGSCLNKFLSSKLKPTAKHLSLWSDSCGGQNRNIKIVLLLKAILVSHPTLETITQNFLESGHSFLPNDTDFGKIESHLKHFERIYTAQDYINIIKGCKNKNPLEVVKMEKEDFKGTKLLEKNIVNRKTFGDKSKVNWLNTKQILIKKEKLCSVFMRTNMEEEYKELNIEKKIKGKSFPISKEILVPLWPDGKQVAQAKLDDLKSMFHLIPEDCLDFYRSLVGSADVVDDIDGYAGMPDFDLDIDDVTD